MGMLINKDTKLYGSFSTNPGNNGTFFFNAKFSELGIDAIYKSYKVADIAQAVQAAITLGFKGFAVSMPFKFTVVEHCDHLSKTAQEIGAVNTVVIRDGELFGYNTDYLGVSKFFEDKHISGLSIIGNGGFSKAIQYYCVLNDIDFEIYTRSNIEYLSQSRYPIFNASPADYECEFDGRPSTYAGKLIARYQAEEQLKLYLQ